MLSAYIAALQAYDKQSKDKGKQKGSKRPHFDGWDQALQSAELAQTKFREAEGRRKAGDTTSSDLTVNVALVALQTSTGAVPNMYESDLIMKYWDDDEVGKT